MKELLEILKTRYETTINSEYDSLFYDNVHAYVDWIVKTPELNNVLEKIEKEYRDKHIAIWEGKTNTKEDSEERARQTQKLERFDTYCLFTLILVRIYWVLEEYKTTDEPDYAQDPKALLMLKGIKNIPRKEWSKLKNGLPDRWSLSSLKSYNEWYDGERKNYETALRQFHVNFLAEIVKNNKDDILLSSNKKIPELYFDSKTGDFRYYQTTGTIKPNTDEFKIFSLLYGRIGIFVKHIELSRIIDASATTISKSKRGSHSQVIRNIKKKLNILPKAKSINPDIFENAPKEGYRLINKDKKSKPE